MKKWHRSLLIATVCMAFNGPLSGENWDPCCCADFGGFYIGVNGGFDSFTWGGNDLDSYFLLEEFSSYKSNKLSWEAGVQMGYDWLWCNKLVGLVADWNWTNASPRIKQNVPGVPGVFPPGHKEIDQHLRWFSTIRGRGGLLWCNALLYITGGVAVMNQKTSIFFTGPFQGAPSFINEHHSSEENQWGWTAGLGTEFALGCGWTFGAELLYMRFDSKRFNFHSPTFDSDVSFDFHEDIWAARFGLNYHFSLCSLW